MKGNFFRSANPSRRPYPQYEIGFMGNRKLHTKSTNSAQLNDSASNHSTPTHDATSPIIPQRSERLSQPPESFCLGIFFTDTGEPSSYEEASTSTDSATWHLAIESEMNSIRANKTWDQVELPKHLHASTQMGLSTKTYV